jgi:hypothetical protein
MADTRLDTAASKFDQALSRFEQVATRKVGDTTRLANLATEAAQLRSENERIVRDLDLVKVKAKELVDVSRQAVSRIDSAMSRIRSVLHTNNPGEDV